VVANRRDLALETALPESAGHEDAIDAGEELLRPFVRHLFRGDLP
jgi:hypothetical protein